MPPVTGYLARGISCGGVVGVGRGSTEGYLSAEWPMLYEYPTAFTNSRFLSTSESRHPQSLTTVALPDESFGPPIRITHDDAEGKRRVDVTVAE